MNKDKRYVGVINYYIDEEFGVFAPTFGFINENNFNNRINSSPLIKDRIECFNKLQKENYPLNIRAFSLRDVIEAFILLDNYSFYANPLTPFIKNLSNPNKEMYTTIVNILNNELHVNPFSVINEELFNSLCCFVNIIICNDLLKGMYIGEVEIGSSSPTQSMINCINNLNDYIKDLKKLNGNTIKEMDKLNIDKIKNKYNFKGVIIYFINSIYSNHLAQKYNRNKDDEKKFRDLLIECSIPESEIEESYLKEACDFIENYTNKKTNLVNQYKVS